MNKELIDKNIPNINSNNESDSFNALKYGKVKYRLEFINSADCFSEINSILDSFGIKHNGTGTFWGFKDEKWCEALSALKEYRFRFLVMKGLAPFIILDADKD